jgi:hypothetical protein
MATISMLHLNRQDNSSNDKNTSRSRTDTAVLLRVNHALQDQAARSLRPCILMPSQKYHHLVHTKLQASCDIFSCLMSKAELMRRSSRWSAFTLGCGIKSALARVPGILRALLPNYLAACEGSSIRVMYTYPPRLPRETPALRI